MDFLGRELQKYDDVVVAIQHTNFDIDVVYSARLIRATVKRIYDDGAILLVYSSFAEGEVGELFSLVLSKRQVHQKVIKISGEQGNV